jgi:hypothetical protein
MTGGGGTFTAGTGPVLSLAAAAVATDAGSFSARTVAMDSEVPSKAMVASSRMGLSF